MTIPAELSSRRDALNSARSAHVHAGLVAADIALLEQYRRAIKRAEPGSDEISARVVAWFKSLTGPTDQHGKGQTTRLNLKEIEEKVCKQFPIETERGRKLQANGEQPTVLSKKEVRLLQEMIAGEINWKIPKSAWQSEDAMQDFLSEQVHHYETEVNTAQRNLRKGIASAATQEQTPNTTAPELTP